MFDKVLVNGDGEIPLFSWLKSSLPAPSDDSESLMGDPKFIIWKPVKRRVIHLFLKKYFEFVI